MTTDFDVEQLSAAIDRLTALLDSTMHKVMLHNPTWETLPKVLTEDELRFYFAFIEAVSGHGSAA